MSNLNPADWENKKDSNRFLMVKSEIKEGGFLNYWTYGVLLWLGTLLTFGFSGWGIVLFFVCLVIVALVNTGSAYDFSEYDGAHSASGFSESSDPNAFGTPEDFNVIASTDYNDY